MNHWGYYWGIKNKQHIRRTLCSTLVSIDSFKILPDNKNSGFRVQPLDIHATINSDHVTVTYRNRKKSSYTIPIDKQACNYGGFRYFFKCPLCQKRMRLLYFAQNSIFLCRKCLNLSYKSQQLRPTKRYDYMSSKVKNHIKSKGGDLDASQRPIGMHQGTYRTLQRKQSYYERKSRQAMNQDLRKWYGAKAEPYIETFFDYVPEKPC